MPECDKECKASEDTVAKWCWNIRARTSGRGVANEWNCAAWKLDIFVLEGVLVET